MNPDDDLQTEAMLNRLAELWTERDPLPAGMVERMRAVASAEAALVDAELDYELMVMVDRAAEAVGTRGPATVLTLRFQTQEHTLLLRVGQETGGDRPARIDGWVVPSHDGPARLSQVEQQRSWTSEVDAHGRFAFPEVPPGFYRLWLEADGGRAVGTPAFEI